MTEQSDVNATKIGLIGAFGTIVTTAFALFAIVLYLVAADRVGRSRSDEAAARIQRQVERIESGEPIGQPWLDADFQRATQETALDRYGVRTIEEATGEKRKAYSVPIEQAMEAVVEEISEKGPEAGSLPKPNDPQNAEVKS